MTYETKPLGHGSSKFNLLHVAALDTVIGKIESAYAREVCKLSRPIRQHKPQNMFFM